MILVAPLASMLRTETMHRNHVIISTRGETSSLVTSVRAIKNGRYEKMRLIDCQMIDETMRRSFSEEDFCLLTKARTRLSMSDTKWATA